MSIRPAIHAGTESTAEYLWESDEVGACVTVERTFTKCGQSLAYVTLWMAVPGTSPALPSGDANGYNRRATVDGELRWWRTIEYASLVDDIPNGIDTFDDEFNGCSVEDIVDEARETATLSWRSLTNR